jgi:hypothetical protein
LKKQSFHFWVTAKPLAGHASLQLQDTGMPKVCATQYKPQEKRGFIRPRKDKHSEAGSIIGLTHEAKKKFKGLTSEVKKEFIFSELGK